MEKKKNKKNEQKVSAMENIKANSSSVLFWTFTSVVHTENGRN